MTERQGRGSRPTTAERVRDRYRRILEAPHRELDRQLDQALQLDDERDRHPAREPTGSTDERQVAP